MKPYPEEINFKIIFVTFLIIQRKNRKRYFKVKINQKIFYYLLLSFNVTIC